MNWYNRQMEKELHSLEALQAEAAGFAKGLSPKEESATLVTLSGDLGAGKTSFTQGVAKALGVTSAVTSPTFVLMKLYPLVGQAFTQLVHIDAYRLQEGKDLLPLNFEEVLADSGNLVLIEWPERVSDALPKADYALSLEVSGEGRKLTYA